MEGNNKQRNMDWHPWCCCYMSTGNCTKGYNWHHSEEPVQGKIFAALVRKGNEVRVYW